MKRKLSGMCWELWVTKINPETGVLFTEDDAKIHVKSFRKNSKYYWMKRGYSEVDGITKCKEFQKSTAKKSAKVTTGVDDRTITQYKYWMNRGYSEYNAKLKVSELQNTFSLDICIAKYGEIDGKTRWDDRQKLWHKTLHANNDMDIVNATKSCTLLSFVEKYGVITGKKKYKKLCKIKNRDLYLVEKTYNIIGDMYDTFFKTYSALLHAKNDRKGQASTDSLRILLPLYRRFRRMSVKRDDIMIGVTGSKEYCIVNNRQKRFYDFTILSENLIVEFNHKSWHPNPDIMTKYEWDSWKHPFDRSKSAKDKYIYDMKKNEIAEKAGFTVITVWSHLDVYEQVKYIVDLYDKN